MSFMDKIKSLFTGGAGSDADASRAAQDQSAYAPAPVAPPMPPADPAGMPTSDAPVTDDEGESRPL